MKIHLWQFSYGPKHQGPVPATQNQLKIYSITTPYVTLEMSANFNKESLDVSAELSKDNAIFRSHHRPLLVISVPFQTHTHVVCDVMLYFWGYCSRRLQGPQCHIPEDLNPLNPELNPICYLLALLGAHHFFHVSRIRVKLLTFRLVMSYIYIWSTHS